MIVCNCFFGDKEFKLTVEQSNHYQVQQSNNVTDDRWKDIKIDCSNESNYGCITSNGIIDYNNHMNGVDKCDQFLASYSFCHKTVKWLKKVFVRMFELSWQLSIVW